MKTSKLFKQFLIATVLTFFTSLSFAQVNVNVTNYSPGSCYPQNIHFTAFAPIGADLYFWNFGDGDTLTTTTDTVNHVYTHGGYFNMYLVAFDSTQNLGWANYNLQIGGGLNVNATTDSACIGEEISFYVWPNANNYNWNFGDTSSGVNNTSTDKEPTHAYANPGTYTLTLIANTMCGLDSTTKSIYVSNTAKPNANFWFRNEVCPNDPVRFGLQNYNATSYMWTFGDPSSGANDTSYLTDNVTHQYASTGKYYITLSLTNECGQTNQRIDSINISDSVEISSYNDLKIYRGNYNGSNTNFTGCPNDEFYFYLTNDFSSYLWNFGDGDSSTSEEPTHVYDTIGNYTLTVKVTNGCGDDTTLSQTVSIGMSPWFGGYPEAGSNSPACPNDPVYFGTNVESAISYLWDFGDGITSTAANPFHYFATTGNKTVSLKITNGCGKDTTIYTTATISDSIAPVLAREGEGGNWGTSVENACIGDSVYVYILGGASYLIDFGDGYITSQTQQISTPMGIINAAGHTYSTLDTFKVKLTLFNNCGRSATDSTYVAIGTGQPINVDVQLMNEAPYFACEPLGFMAMGGVSYKWNFGNGDTLTTTNSFIEYSYATAGDYDVSVFVTNGCGDTATTGGSLTILNIPAPVITKTGSTLSTDVASSYQWYLNDTLIAGATNITYIPTISGSYKVTITNANGCTSTSAPFTDCFLYAGPDVNICAGGSVQLIAMGAQTYSWTPADSLSNANIANPVAFPDVTTEYIVTGTTGTCVVNDTVNVNIVVSLTAEAGTDKSICEGSNVILEGSGGGNYKWANASSLNVDSIATPIATPTSTTTYTLTVSSGSCISIDSVLITVNPTPTANAGSDASICRGSSVTLTATGIGSYAWSNGDTTSSIIVNPSMNITYTVTVTSDSLCTSTDEVTVTVNDKPMAIAGNDVVICEGINTTLIAAGNGSFYWSTGDSTSTAIVNPTTTTTYYVTVTNTALCSSTDSLVVSTNTPIAPTVSISGDTLYSSTAATYQWYYNDTIISGANSIYYIPLANGYYKVNTPDSNGCLATSTNYAYNNAGLTKTNETEGIVTIYPNPANDFVNITFKGMKSGERNIEITNVNGQLVYNKYSNNNTVEHIDVSTLPTGIYFVKVKGQNFIKVDKFLKQ